MKDKTVLIEHIAIALLSLTLFLGLAFLFFTITPDILSNPQNYFQTSLSADEFKYFLIQILTITTCALASFIIYLLLSLNTRAEIFALRKNKFLNDSLKRLNELYGEAPVPYFILDEKGIIKSVNKSTLRFLKVTANEIVGKSFFFYETKDKNDIEKHTRYYKSGIPIEREEIKVSIGDKEIKWALLSIFITKVTKDFTHYGLASMFDITEQKQLDQAKTQFVSLASHQLRTPVAAIKWYSDVLISGDFGEISPKQKEYLDRIHKINEEMNGLIETLLNISRVEIGKIKPDFKETNVQDIIESVIDELAVQVENKQITINKNYENELKDVNSDQKLLRIIIQNLISNSIKYNQNGGNIVISLKEIFGEKEISISDNGIGIPENQKDKIFTKMFRADNAKSMVGGQGTGLGLYLIKSLIEAMGGSISFSSEENKGSTFVVKL